MLTTPEDLIPAIALALLAGLRGAAPGRRALFLLPAAWFAGGLAGLTMSAAATFPLAAISFLLLGVLVAANAPLTARGVAAIALGLGLAHGFFNGIAFHGSASGTLALVGEAAVLFALVGPRLGVRRVPRAPLDPHRRARGRKLDRRDRTVAPRVGPARIPSVNGISRDVALAGVRPGAGHAAMLTLMTMITIMVNRRSRS